MVRDTGCAGLWVSCSSSDREALWCPIVVPRNGQLCDWQWLDIRRHSVELKPVCSSLSWETYSPSTDLEDQPYCSPERTLSIRKRWPFLKRDYCICWENIIVMFQYLKEGIGKIILSIKYLLCKHMDLNSVPRTLRGKTTGYGGTHL